jgi:excisionase family DNA binding protein
MANHMLNQELDAILGAVAQSPEGVGIAELENAAPQYLGRPLNRRTLQRRLDLLMADKKIIGVGKSVARVYKLSSGDATAYVQGDFTHEQVFRHLQHELLSAFEAAEYLEVSLPTLRRYVQANKLRPCHTVGRNQMFSAEDLRTYKRARQ